MNAAREHIDTALAEMRADIADVKRLLLATKPMQSAEEAAVTLMLSVRRVHALTSAGKLASHRVGHRVWYSIDDLHAYLRSVRRPAITERTSARRGTR